MIVQINSKLYKKALTRYTCTIYILK